MGFIGFIKHCYNRITKGYSDRDLFNMDWWFLETIPNMLEDFKKGEWCYPMYCNSPEEWDAILDRMIFCFREAHPNTCSKENEYKGLYDLEDIFNENSDKKDIVQKSWDRDRQIEKYQYDMKNEAMNLFKEHFSHFNW